jgi:RNA polymerase sigma factor (sigma-70 family)
MLSPDDYHKIAQSTVSHLRNRPYTWDAEDVYQEAYLLCLQYDLQFDRIASPQQKRFGWLRNSVKRRMRELTIREQQWCRRSLTDPKIGLRRALRGEPLERDHHNPHGAMSYVPSSEVASYYKGPLRYEHLNPADFLFEQGRPENIVDLMEAVELLAPPEPPAPPPDSPEEALEAWREEARVWGMLPGVSQKNVVLLYLKGRGNKQIAISRGISDTAVKQILAQAIASLRRLMGEGERDAE